ncbi:MAG TPA: hypothetical protein VJT73_20775 [Polyangiaceae bacterium]|nr:hypothetical protein [Polyangiaceae bacterium]
MSMAMDQGLERRLESVDGRVVGVASYPLGRKFVCTVDNIHPGTVVARADGATRFDAERSALALAEARLARARHLQETLRELRSCVASLDKRLSEPPPRFSDG